MFTTMLTIAGGILLAVLFLFLLLTEAGRNILLGLLVLLGIGMILVLISLKFIV